MNHLVSINRNVLRAIAQTTNRFRQVNLFSTLQKDYQENMRKAKRETYDSASISDTTSDEEIQDRKSKRVKKSKTTKEPKKQQKNVQKAEMPKDFRKQYDLIVEMRKNRDAPVDTQGAECCPDPNAEPKVFRYQALLGLMLSSQTKDEVTTAAMNRLKEYGCTPQHIIETDEEKIQELIKPVGFYRRKATYIKKTTQVLLDEYDGDIPDTIEGLVKLPGVGPKMGYLILKVAWNKVDGIGVDVHVHRISNRLQWVNTKTPEETRVALESWLPRELWHEVNLLLVGFGQTICGSSPKCEKCKLHSICPASTCSDIEDLEKDEDDKKVRTSKYFAKK